jgi:hypothetical protein
MKNIFPISLSKIAAAVIIILSLFGSQQIFAQQIIGSYPSIDGGFEAQSNGNLTTAGSIAQGVQSTAWTRTASTNITATVTGTGGRSGPKYFTWSSTNASAQRANSPTTADNTISNSTSYVIQYFYRTTAVPSGTGYAISADNTSNTTTATSTLANTAGAWTKVSFVISTNNVAVVTPRYGLIQPLRTGAAANGVAVDLDDVVLYAGTAADVTAPASPGAVTAAGALGGVNVSWGAAAGTDGGGYVVVRYAGTAPAASDDPNQNGIYAVGNIIAGAVTGTVRYIGTGTSFTDNTNIAGATDYYYKVYTVDKAFNYSDESVSTPVQATPAYFYYKGTGSLAATGSWGLNADGTGTSPADFTTDNQTFEIRNTIAVSTDAAWIVSGANSKVILGNAATPAPAITLTLTAGNPITTNSTSFDISQPSSGHHKIIYQNPTVLSLGNVNDPAPDITYDGVTISTATTKTYGNIELINNSDVTFSNIATFNTLLVNTGNAFTAASTGNINISGGGSVIINGIFRTARQGGLTGVTGAITFTSTPNITLGASSLIDYNRNGALTQAINAVSYANLTISGTSPKTIEAGPLKIAGDFISTTTGVINTAVSSVEFNGSAAQSIPAFTFNDLKINNAAGVTMSTVNVGGILSLTSGVVTTTGVLTLDVNASVAGGSNTSYIDGVLTKLTNTSAAFLFPMGKTGAYRPVTLTPASAAAGSYTAGYFKNAQGTVALTPPLVGINTDEYWNVTKNSGPDASVSLPYNNSTDVSWGGTAPNPSSEIVVAHLPAALWTDETGTTGTVLPGTAPSGTVTSQAMSSFSPFTFGVRLTAVVPLTLTDISVARVSKQPLLSWRVSNEINMLKYETEKSYNGIDFSFAGTVTSLNSTIEKTYSWVDPKEQAGTNYYRLKMINTDGSFTYSKVVSLKNNFSDQITLSPNPVVSVATLSNLKSERNVNVIITNPEGKTVKTIFVAKGLLQKQIDLSDLSAGIYFLKIIDGEQLTTLKIVKQ